MENILPQLMIDLSICLDGPLHFRFTIQPLIATRFAFLDGGGMFAWELLSAHHNHLISPEERLRVTMARQ